VKGWPGSARKKVLVSAVRKQRSPAAEAACALATASGSLLFEPVDRGISGVYRG